MSVNAKRRWYQIHLSTAVVLMLVAGGIVGCNSVRGVADRKDFDDHPPYEEYVYGWPVVMYDIETDHYPEQILRTFYPWGIAVNASILILAPLGFAGFCEYLIRRATGTNVMSEPKRKRSWFRFHLSTVWVIALLAGVLMGLNFFGTSHDNGVYELTYGWPLPISTETLNYDISTLERITDRSWNVKNCAVDGLAAFAILVATAFACEWWIRRKKHTADGER